MLDAIFEGLQLAFSFPALWFLLLGIFIGIWVGVLPGLGVLLLWHLCFLLPLAWIL